MPIKNPKIGIYKITCKSTGNFYIGSSSACIQTRWRKHTLNLRQNKHHSPYLQNSWNKYGKEQFEFEIIELCSKDETLTREQFYLDTLSPQFNVHKFAFGPIGRKASEKQKEAVRKASLGNKYNLGRKKSLETLKLISIPLVGIDKNNNKIEFYSMKEAVKTFRDKGTRFNLNGLKESMKKNKSYYGFNWSIN